MLHNIYTEYEGGEVFYLGEKHSAKNRSVFLFYF